MAWSLRLRPAAAAAHEGWPRQGFLSPFELLHERFAPGREPGHRGMQSRG